MIPIPSPAATRPTPLSPRCIGFSLIEVLISIIVIAFGLLGIAKMQSLGIANTQIAGIHSLIALQASSLAASLHSNNGFWQVSSTATAPTNPHCPAPGCSMQGIVLTDPGNVLTSPPGVGTCTATTPCSPTQLAALDISNWMSSMNQQVPSYTANISCSNSITLPTSCTIDITWVEKAIGMNNTTASATAAQPSQTQSYYLYIQP